ncbi:hypothetical protein [Stenotrophomonas oahuensis]|uniref:Uncharacterized protein n=1 Tax=Stenotrophomonas oahuensis TaxID=3003271 RepID=A0ABY9YNB5_9GAMM|nr:hypothetical protein [Stenotrophomonas sp. A5586]WNH52390.1 hypothetical protein PDM29_18990 [Stenotrophomonas sp. A5586]
MIVTRIAVMCTLLLSGVALAGQARYLTLLNRAHDSVVAVEVAAQGSEAYLPRVIDPVPGGGGSTTVRLGQAGCRFDVRLQFRNGRQAVYRDVDACKGDTLVIVPLPRQ